MASVSTSADRSTESGLLAGIGTFTLWGFLPLLFGALRHVGAVTVVADRIFWALLLVGAIVVLSGRMTEVRQVLHDWRKLRAMALAALILGCNWLIYIYAVETEQVLEASFGYFINPLLTVALGAVVLKEKQSRLQRVALAIALVAVAIQAVGLGGVPYIALSLALTFAVYGYIRKMVQASSTTGLFIETLVLAPLAIGYLVYSFISEGSVGPHADPYTLFLLILTGPGTAAPLLLFAYAAQRLRLTTIGMLQYIAPIIAFGLAVTVFNESLNVTRLFSFALIWVALAVFSADSLLRLRRQRQADAVVTEPLP